MRSGVLLAVHTLMVLRVGFKKEKQRSRKAIWHSFLKHQATFISLPCRSQSSADGELASSGPVLKLQDSQEQYPGSWPQGSGKCCLLPMSCPHWAPGGRQIVHILQAGNQSSTMHNSPVALSHGQHHCSDVRRQPVEWSQGCSACIDFGSRSRRVTLSRTVTALCTRPHILHSLQHPGIHTDPSPRFIVKP